MTSANWTTRYLIGNEQDGQAAREPAAQSAAPTSLVGSRIGAYLITKRLGVGGVGKVYKAVDVMLKRDVAIKILRDELAADPIFLERFRREAQLHAKLSHPNVASLHAFLHEGGKEFIVMEYVAGISLDEFVRCGGPVPVGRALGIFRRALDGIEHAHQCGIVHRDIKPANIMLADSGQVKVMDFGIARALDSHDQLTRHGHVAGTAKSMAPEQIRGKPADVRSDIYSAGIVLYTLLAGRPPFEGASDLALMKAQLDEAPPRLRTLVDGLPLSVEAAVMRALEKDPSARFQTVRDFGRAIDACLADRHSSMPAPAVDRHLDAPTATRTAINPALQGLRQLPAVPAANAGRVEPVAATSRPVWLRWTRVAGISLAGLTLVGTAALLGPQWLATEGLAVASAQPPALAQPTLGAQPPAPAAEPASGAAAQPAVAAPESVPAAAPAPVPVAAKPLGLAILRLPADGGADAASPSDHAVHEVRSGERIQLLVKPDADAHVYCYLQDENRRVVRFYPNRFQRSAQVKAAQPLQIPGKMGFELVANTVGATETVACFASERDLGADLPVSVVGADFAKLPVASIDEVREAFARVATDAVARGTLQIDVR